MQISRNLPQFEDHPTLIIVCGAQTARIYHAHNGEIEEIAQYREPNPKYSDREGFFITSGHGETFSSGSVYESNDDSVRDHFLKELHKTLNSLQHKYEFDTAILVAPDYVENQIQEALPDQLKRKTTYVLEGNFIKHHEHDLLKAIQEKLRK